MRMVDVITRKRDGHALSREAIEMFVSGVTSGLVPDYQASALLIRPRAGNELRAEVMQEPMDQPHGVRDCAFRDPAGNMVRFSQDKA